MTWILLNKRWTAIIILLVVVVIQTAITNRYVGLLKQAEQQCQAQIQDIEREVQKIVERPVYKSACVDADGVQQINDLIKAGNTS